VAFIVWQLAFAIWRYYYLNAQCHKY